jgi:APA family basic amino acid/polyamine antiporter
MSQELLAGEILLAWMIGAALALCGALAYGALAEAWPSSGGEYRYLSESLHPFVGYVAGWASLLVGFAGPIAIDAIAAGAFVAKLWPGIDPERFAIALIVGLIAFHSLDLRVSKSAQNAMVALKVTLLLGFIGAGLAFGSHEVPTWTPPKRTGFDLDGFVGSLFFIAYAFSGWNAATYSSGEFVNPRRDVVRSMLIGCGGVAVAYLLVNLIIVVNVTPEAAAVVFSYESERLTLAHVVAEIIGGPTAAKVASAALAVALISAASAMMFVGPRVFAAMASDGFLPRRLAAPKDKPPFVAVVLQGVLAIVILLTHRIQELLGNVGAVLTLFSGLTALGVFTLARRRPGSPPPSLTRRVAAGVYAGSAALMLVIALRRSPLLWMWALAFVACASVAFVLTRKARSVRAE